MKLTKKLIFILLPAFMYATQSQAQKIDEWQTRPSASLKYQLNKNWSVTGTYYLYIDDNFRDYDKSELGAEIEYKVNSWMDVGVDYRYGLEKGGHGHDIRSFASFDYDPSDKWEIAFRTMVQQEFESLKEKYLEKHPVEHYWRNKFTVSYELTRNIDLYVFTENYLEIGKSNLFFHRQKTGIGAEFDFTDRSEIETRFEIRNKSSGKNEARINVGYTYTFGYGK